MDGHVGLQQPQQRRSSHMGLQRCALALTLLLLLFEVIVSRLCNCLTNMVDSFHTLYLLLHLALQHLQARQPPLASSSTSSIAPSPSPANSFPSSTIPHNSLHKELNVVPGALHPDPGTITDPPTSEHTTTTNVNTSSSSTSLSSSIAPSPSPANSLPSNAISHNSLQSDLNVTSQTPAAAAATTPTPNHDTAPEALHPDPDTITDPPTDEHSPITTKATINANVNHNCNYIPANCLPDPEALHPEPDTITAPPTSEHSTTTTTTTTTTTITNVNHNCNYIPANCLPDPDALHPDPDTITAAPTSEHSTTTNTTNNVNSSSSTTSRSPLFSEPCVVARLQPFGALVSALLVASLCVSVTLEILHHVLQPHPLQRPLLATVASALSLLFNAAVLAVAWGRGGRPLGAPATAAAVAADVGSETLATSTSTTGSRMGSNHSVIALENVRRDEQLHADLGDGDGSLMFCNPAASSVLDGKHVPFAPSTVRYSKHVSFAIPAAPGCDRGGVRPSGEPNAVVDGHLNNLSRSQQSNAVGLEDGLSRVPVYTAHPRNSGNSASLYNGHPSTPFGAPSTTVQRGTSRLYDRMTLLRDLLCPCLALANALASLLGTPDCHPPRESCSSLVYLDPALSTAAVLVLLAFALPEVHRLGLLLLQSRPPQLSVPELKSSLVGVQGVVGVHELHVWQLNESCWVASVHVHVNVNVCGSGCGCACHRSEALNKVVEGMTEILRRAGVSVCTVQPEVFIERAGGEMAVPPVEAGGLRDWPCSLACGEKCEKMLCCSPATQEDKRDTTPSSGKAQGIIFENTHVGRAECQAVEH